MFNGELYTNNVYLAESSDVDVYFVQQKNDGISHEAIQKPIKKIAYKSELLKKRSNCVSL